MKWFTSFMMVFLWCAYSEVRAGEIERATVDFVHDTYTVEFDGQISAVPSEVYRLLTDHNHLYLLNDDVLESVLLALPDTSVKKRHVVLHVCILFFCRDIKFVESLQENGKDELIATVIPSGSDFRFGRTVWKITPAGVDQSRLQLRSTFRPAFWVPPVIGPWLIRMKVEEELSVTITRLEHYAGAGQSH